MKRFAFLMICLFLLALAMPVLAQDQPAFGDLPAGEWTQIAVPDAVCMYDDDYSIFVRPAEPVSEKLMIYFQGGGACWDNFTCSAIGQFASQYDVTEDEVSFATRGIFDYSNAENPVADYNAVFIPYCSGDVFSGSADIVYDDVRVQYNGFANAQAALAWVYENFFDPEELFITGCSAGGYGSVFHAAYIMNQYGGTNAVHVADASNGVLWPEWDGLETWGTIDGMPEFIESLATIELVDYNTTVHMIEMAKTFPQNIFGQVNMFLDGVQVGFYGLMKGVFVDQSNFQEVAGEWSAQMFGNVMRMATEVDNIRTFTGGGLDHCVLDTDKLYTIEVAGVRLVDWLASMVSRAPSGDVTCSLTDGECLRIDGE